jgi:hypothetical protein
VRPHHQPLRQDRTSADVDVAQHYRRTSDLRLGLVGEQLVEAHGRRTAAMFHQCARLRPACQAP